MIFILVIVVAYVLLNQDDSITDGVTSVVEQVTGLSKLPWIPLKPPVVYDRSPISYFGALARFDVPSNPRYRAGQAGGRDTYCNIFVWDCTAGLGCEVPHWVDDNGEKTLMGVGHEQDANEQIDWIASRWSEVGENTARARVAEGFPVICAYRAPAGSIGHVAMMLPNGNICQAGRNNFFDEPLSHGFGNLPVRFYTHD